MGNTSFSGTFDCSVDVFVELWKVFLEGITIVPEVKDVIERDGNCGASIDSSATVYYESLHSVPKLLNSLNDTVSNFLCNRDRANYCSSFIIIKCIFTDSYIMITCLQFWFFWNW